MPIEMTTATTICSMCGMAYPKRNGYFYRNYSQLYKGSGYLGICKSCVDKIYSGYLSRAEHAKDALRQTCRKLDLYWSDHVYEMVDKKSTSASVIGRYMAKLNTSAYLGKGYDDTLIEEDTMWKFSVDNNGDRQDNSVDITTNCGSRDNADNGNTGMEDGILDESPLFSSTGDIEITDEIIDFWGGGYSKAMYQALEQRWRYWKSHWPADTDITIGTEAILKQICSLELDVVRERNAGRPVDKITNTLNTLYGSLNIKPNQKKDDADGVFERTPFGVWVQRFEDKAPIPEPDPEYKDVDGIIKYITIWFFGHLSKMLNIKGSRSKLYEEAIDKWKVEREEEFDDSSDEDILYDIFGDKDGGDAE